MYHRFFFLIIYILSPASEASGTHSVSETRNDPEIFRNWISIHQQTEQDSLSSEPLWNTLAEEFFQLYLQTNEVIYLNFAFSEAGRVKRAEIISRPELNLESVDPDYAALYILRTDESKRYDLRDFTADELYIFLIHRIPPEQEENARKLLDHWYKQFYSEWEQDKFRASFTGQALLYGFYRVGDMRKVVEIGTLLLDNHPFPPSLYTIDLFRNLANASNRIGYQRLTARVYSEILIPLSEEFYRKGNPSELADFLYLYGTSLYLLGELNRAIEAFEQVTEMMLNDHVFSFEENLYNNMAVSYLNMGFFDRYIRYQLRSLDLAFERNNIDMQILILSNLYNFHRNRNDFNEASGYLRMALETATQNELLSESANLLIISGIHQREDRGNPEEALEYFYRAVDAAAISENYRHRLNSILQLAETYYETGDPESGKSYFLKAIETTDFQQDPIYHLTAIAAYANTATRFGDFKDAEELLAILRSNDLSSLSQDIQVVAANAITRLYLHNGDQELAYRSSRDITDKVMTWLTESVEEQSGMIRLRKEFSQALYLYFTSAAATDRVHDALVTAGRLRNISRSGIYNNPLLKASLLTDEEISRDNQLSSEIQQLRNQLRNAAADQRPYLNNQILLALSERNELLNTRMPNRESLNYSDLLGSTRSLLRRDEMVVYFARFEQSLFQFLITRENVELITHDAGRIDLLLNRAIDRFGRGTTDLLLLSELYTLLFKEKIPPSVRGLYIVPDGELYRLPVEILPVNKVSSSHSFGSARYLIEEYRISYLNTLTDLKLKDNRTSYSYSFAGFGLSDFPGAGHSHLSVLPYTRDEINQSAKAFPKSDDWVTFFEEESTKRRLVDMVGKSRILHLATHSRVNESDPLFSVLYLHPSENDSEEKSDAGRRSREPLDPNLYAYELFDLNLNAELVFLSSCESGSGGYLKGSGILGLSRSLSYAGAKRLILNLWPVGDQASSFIAPLFYRNFSDGNSKSESLRQAKIHYLNNYNSDPYLWGPFVLYGPDTGNSKPVSPVRYFLVMITAGLIFLAFKKFIR